MKKIIGLFLMAFASFIGYGQAQEGTVEYQKKLQPAAVIDLPYPPSIVNAAMDDYLSKKGKSKGSDMKGFTTYRNTQALQSDSSNADLYFKTERKSRAEKEITVVSLLLLPADADRGTNLHYLSMDDARTYLNDLAQAVGSYDLELTIKEQNEAVAKAEAKYKSLASDGQDLDKKRSALDKKIEDNKNDQQQQLKEIEKEKEKLAQWVSRRKS
ncbi:MAG TPA: hypothetical protein VGC95_13330 [Chitinophagaceae bacterium]